MPKVVWFRGVPWDSQTMAAARALGDPGLVEVVTELAREVRLVRHDRPEPGSRIEVERAGWKAVLSGELVVIGYAAQPEKVSGSHGTVSPSASDAPDGPEHPAKGKKRRGRGPVDYAELIDWLTDEGFIVQTPKGRNHPVVLSPTGVRLVTLPCTPSEPRGIKNAVAACRRVLGIELRR